MMPPFFLCWRWARGIVSSYVEAGKGSRRNGRLIPIILRCCVATHLLNKETEREAILGAKVSYKYTYTRCASLKMYQDFEMGRTVDCDKQAILVAARTQRMRLLLGGGRESFKSLEPWTPRCPALGLYSPP